MFKQDQSKFQINDNAVTLGTEFFFMVFSKEVTIVLVDLLEVMEG